MKRYLILFIFLTNPTFAESPQTLTVGAKSFTESVTLAEIAKILGEEVGAPFNSVSELGGTRVLWSALKTGEISVYPEYTGTIREELFRGESLPDEAAIRKRLAREGISMTSPLGFNNTYALGMKESLAEELNIKTISDLNDHPTLKYGFGNEFMDRADGWPSLKAKYNLVAQDTQGMEHALTYRGVDSNEIQVTDVYATDPNINKFNLRVLKDDKFHFPKYEAVYLYRTELEKTHPKFISQLRSMAGRLSDQSMLSLNEQVELDNNSEAEVAARFVRETFQLDVTAEKKTLSQRIWATTIDHLFLVLVSLSGAILVGVPAGIVCAKTKLPGQIILGFAEIVQTIPGLALLVFMGVIFVRLDLPSIGAFPVIVALFLYSLLPIIRNTLAGLNEIPTSLQESATALGLNWFARLRLVELPLAAPLILTGIKTTAVINVGYAALGGLIGAGGYGQPIMTGLRLNSESLMLEGAIPAAALALLVKWFFEYAERIVVPKGLRLSSTD
ncbi:ABC transporter permease/substrate-binding protein [Thalassoglobus polymorphus]|uniref:Glycine betaine/carnitine/choline transport system permease protein OpuCB n=1 Tax=Thalassoglobus polymorphus TaxID=2527994 RepID=A0A517QNI8_9PLAN|nr:glycine betaine ABC transporter substrate-binding protein [Thalassoglobus polymorphus]QDT33147.1 Glycine betaine/carnitine/choline transport system permease protein OpuCB [Thalassoglobus polymorphus]